MTERERLTLRKTLLITDVDNTLFDWVDVWYKSFSAMLRETSRISGISAESLYPSIARIHQAHGTSEYAFLLEEIPELKSLYGNRVTEHLGPAIDAFRQARRQALILYPGVESTLRKLKDTGVRIVAYTESMAFYTNYRFRKLGLDELVDYLYSPPDHVVPGKRSSLRKYPPEHYELQTTIHKHTPKGELKPNPHILLSIISEMEANTEASVYIGDSLMKDVAMAQTAQVDDVLAEYGASQHRSEYELLRKVTHWRKEDVDREKAILANPKVIASKVIKANFSEIMNLFDWGAHG